MTSSQSQLLDLPTSTAVAGFAAHCLDDAAQAVARLSDRRDLEAVHDFRVAVRRLRSNLRAYRPWLRKAAGRKIRRSFRELGAATNAARDAEIQLAWLQSVRSSLPRGERTGLNWVARHLRDVRRDSYLSMRNDGRPSFERAAETLRESLADLSADSPPLRIALSALLRDHAEDLGANLATIRSAGDKKPVHESRICAKRLRYLLEPLRRESSVAKGLVRSFKVIQDLLGDLHDVHVLEGALETALDDASREKSARLRQLALAGDRSTLDRERRRDERLGLVTLAARARNRRDELYNEFEKQWLRGRATELLREVQGFAESIGPPEERSDVREERSDVRGERNDVRGERTGIPGTLPIECERKDLLSALPIRALAAPSVEIEQGWLPGKTLRERIRRTSDQDGDRYFRTVKLGSGVERIEIEEETTAEIFAAMWPLTRGCRISKRRYLVPDGDLVWEVDQFADRDLVLAEVELESGEQEVSLPEWLQPSVVREVTEDPAYLNLSLAMQAA